MTDLCVSVRRVLRTALSERGDGRRFQKVLNRRFGRGPHFAKRAKRALSA